MKKNEKIGIKDYKKLIKKAELLRLSESEKSLEDRDDSLIDECVETILFCNEEIAAIRAERGKTCEKSPLGNKAFVRASLVFLAGCLVIIGSILTVGAVKKQRSADNPSNNVEVHITDSAVYEKQEIVSAMDVVSALFSKNWTDCALKTLSYAGDTAIPIARKTGTYGNDYQVMVLNVDFTMGEKKTALYEPNTEYMESDWVLVKKYDESWIIRDYVDSEVFGADDIRAATDAAILFFKANWHGCELYRIGYAGDDAAKDIKNYGGFSENDRVLVLKSDFAVGSEADPSLEPNAVYTDWAWILVKDDEGEWIVRDWGY